MFIFIAQVIFGAVVVVYSLQQAEQNSNQPEPRWVELARQERTASFELNLYIESQATQLDLLDSDDDIYEAR